MYYYAVVDLIALEEGGFTMAIVSLGEVCVEGPHNLLQTEAYAHRR